MNDAPPRKPQDCLLSAWKQTSQCSKKCGGGTFEVEAKVIKPAVGNGKKCGPLTKRMPCNILPCPIDGKFGPFGPWSKCSRACGGGIKMRSRKCDKPKPQNGGAFCKGAISQFTTCNKAKCTGVKSCADLKMLYAKAVGKIKGERVAAVKGIDGFTMDLTLLRDEVRDGEQLTIGINKLPAGSLKHQAAPLVKRMLAEARKALQEALDKLRDAKAGLAGYDKKLASLKTEFDSKIAKCTCDENERTLLPLIARAEAKVKDYDYEIATMKSQVATQTLAMTRMRNLAQKYSTLPRPLGPLMTKMFQELMNIEGAKIDRAKKLAQNRARSSKDWMAKVDRWYKQLAGCADRARTWGIEFEATLRSMDMGDIWEETEFGLAYQEDIYFQSPEMKEIASRLQSDESFVETLEETEEGFPVESGFAAIMLVGGLAAFYLGHRNSQSSNYQQLA